MTKADADRQAQAAEAIEKAGDEFAKQVGISPEKARTILRRANRYLADVEAGRA